MGAKDHATTISEVHVQGNGGYGIGHFAVTVPEKDGKEKREEGNLAVIYQREASGWHIKLLVPSALPAAKYIGRGGLRLARLVLALAGEGLAIDLRLEADQTALAKIDDRPLNH